MPITTLHAEVSFEGTRLHRLLKESEQQIPRGLKPARDDKNKELNGAPFGWLRAGSKGAPLQNTRCNRLFPQPLQPCREEAAEELWGTLLVGAPCFSRGKLDFSPAEERSISKWALTPGFPIPGAKAQDQSPTFSRSAEALLPPHKCGGSHQEVHSTSYALTFSAASEAVPFQGMAQKNTAHRDDLHFITRALMSSLLIAVTAMLVSCSKKPEETEPVVTVQTAVAQRGTIQQVIGAEAILFPRDQAAITPKVVAPVRTFYVNRGSRVQRGQVLAVLENRDLAAAEVENKGSYEQAQAAYGLETSSALPEEWQKAELDLKTAKESYDAQQKVYDSRQILFQQGALPRKQFDESAVALIQAKAQYEMTEKHLSALQSAGKQQQMKGARGQLTSAKGKYEGAAAQLGYTEIRSPINGVVTDRPSYPGETPPPGTPLLTIMDTSSVIAHAHIPQNDAAVLKLGDTATLTGPGVGMAGVIGKVTQVSPALDPNSTTVEVWIEAANPDGRLRPGTTVNVQIVAQTLNDAIVVPVSALLKTPEGQTTVMIVKGDRAHQVSVETGIRQGDRVQIAKGLSGGETVIVSGAYGLPDNTKVKIAEAAPPASPGKSESSQKDAGKD